MTGPGQIADAFRSGFPILPAPENTPTGFLEYIPETRQIPLPGLSGTPSGFEFLQFPEAAHSGIVSTAPPPAPAAAAAYPSPTVLDGAEDRGTGASGHHPFQQCG